ncbi:MAG: hypothetical protein KGN32_15915 [Burkholderiales bacterium]|nr:hypothetical protein [Burkholderiales bacterium]
MRLVARLFLLLTLAFLGEGARASDVVAVLSERGASYREALDTLVSELWRAGLTVSDTDVQNPTGVAATLAYQNPRMVVTLGYESLRQVLEGDSRIPVVAALIPRAGFERLVRGRPSARPVAALYLDQPVARQLELVRLAFGAARRVAVILGPDSSGQQVHLAAAAISLGLTLQSAEVGPSRTVANALAEVLDGADVLLALPDGQVYNATTVSNVLITSYRAHVPMLAFSPAYVRAGATLALHSTPVQVGQQVAQMVKHSIQSGLLSPSQYPTDFSVTINERVARSLDLDLHASQLTEQLKRTARKP